MTINTSFAYFAPEIAECLDEAFELAGVAPDAAGQDHIASALRSIRFMLNSEWHNLGMRQWMIARYTQALTNGVNTFDLPAGTIDIFNAVLSRDSRETPMYRMSREEYLEIPDKTITGRPDRYFVDRRYDRATVYIWQAPSNSTDTMIIDTFKQMANPGAMGNTLQMPPHALDAFVHGLGARLALKYNEKKYAMLQTMYWGGDANKPGGKLGMALDEDRDRSPVVMTIGLNRRGR